MDVEIGHPEVYRAVVFISEEQRLHLPAGGLSPETGSGA